MLKFTGIGSAHCQDLGCCCAYFFYHGHLILLDCGEDTFAQLKRTHVLEAAKKEIYCFVTHMHSDHVGSLPTLCLYCASQYNKKVHVCFPGSSAIALLGLMGVLPTQVKYENRFPVILSGTLQIECLTAEHVPHLECYGYLIRAGDTAIYYSGDAKTIPPRIKSMLLARKLARLYQDVSFCDGAPAHLGFVKLCEEIQNPDLRKRVYAMHFDAPDYKEKIESAGFRAVERA